MNQALRDFGVEVTAAILGVDRLYRDSFDSGAADARHDDLGREGLVAINLSSVAVEFYPSWAEARRHWQRIAREVMRLDHPDRRAYFGDLAGSILAFIDWQDSAPLAHLPIDDFTSTAGRLLGLEPLIFSDAQWRQAREQVAHHLAAAGYQGELEEALAAWEAAEAVDPDQVIPTLDRLLAEGRERVEQQMFRLPPERTMSAVGERDVAYSAFCDFEAGLMRINLDQTYTYPALRHLVAHEAYPGHLTHIAVREEAARSGETTEDALLVVTDTATSPIFEGIGDSGLHFCWQVGLEDRLALAVQHMRTVAACRAALRLAQGQPVHEVRASLAAEAAAPEAWVAQRMRFLSYPLRRPFIFAYGWGANLVLGAWRQVASGRRQAFYERLYRQQHSPQSLRLIEEVHG